MCINEKIFRFIDNIRNRCAMEHCRYTKHEAIEKLCRIVTDVGEAFAHTYTHDCICGMNKISEGLVDSHIIEFIQQAVTEKLIKLSSLCERM